MGAGAANSAAGTDDFCVKMCEFCRLLRFYEVIGGEKAGGGKAENRVDLNKA